ncbi:c-type cytochrome [Sulfuricurvum sp.]|uniref:c-type cytochrome n=1 Tax=Sulfuricurvum sp. TaxID=2025608 RepID=UPI003BB77B58
MKSVSLFISMVVFISIGATSLTADIASGQKWYTKGCKSCHGNGSKGAAMHTQEEWDELFKNGGAVIIKKHAKTPAEVYFNGENFQSKSKDLRDFLFEYGSDSGNVPAC